MGTTLSKLLPRTHEPDLADRIRLGKGHWVLQALMTSDNPKYSPDNGQHWYSICNGAGKIVLYDADLWVQKDEAGGSDKVGLVAQQIPINALCGVSGGILHRKARTLEAKKGTV